MKTTKEQRDKWLAALEESQHSDKGHYLFNEECRLLLYDIDELEQRAEKAEADIEAYEEQLSHSVFASPLYIEALEKVAEAARARIHPHTGDSYVALLNLTNALDELAALEKIK